jgi:hypothetical protein
MRRFATLLFCRSVHRAISFEGPPSGFEINNFLRSYVIDSSPVGTERAPVFPRLGLSGLIDGQHTDGFR